MDGKLQLWKKEEGTNLSSVKKVGVREEHRTKLSKP